MGLPSRVDNLGAEYQLGIGPDSLLWIDTQGHEGHVFEGAKNLIDCGRIKFVVAEFWPYGLERANGREKFFNFLSRCSAIYDLRQTDWRTAHPLTDNDLRKKYETLITEGVGHTDLLCILQQELRALRAFAQKKQPSLPSETTKQPALATTR